MSIHQIDQLILLQRLLIIFGSICLLWLLIGLIFLCIETYCHLKEKTNRKPSGHHFTLHLPSSTSANNKRTLAEDDLLDNDQNDEDDSLDDQTSIVTSVSFISDRPKLTHEPSYFTASCRRVSDEHFTLPFPSTTTRASNAAYSPSTPSSTGDNDPSLFYQRACQNFAYSQSTLASTNDNCEQKMSTPSLIIPLINSTSFTHQFNFERQSSQSSTNTILSQVTHVTSLSKSSIKPAPLPTLMITDVDRLQTDIIELDEFEPEKDWHRPVAQLRLLLNDRLPSEVK